MASLGHVAVGMALGRAFGGRGAPFRQRAMWMIVFSGLALLPDADVIAFLLGVPYSHPFGHRGASHSLFAAAVLGSLVALAAFVSRRPLAARSGVFVALAVGSHGLLDALTDGGLGAALLWPFSDARFFAPWQPLPVAPIGLSILGPAGLYVLAVELVAFLPMFAWALWPASPAKRG